MPVDYKATLAAIEKKSGHPTSEYQRAIFKEIHKAPKDSGNLLVEAVAGSGKTTTIINSLQFLPTYTKNIIVAFNKHIADELNKRGLPSHTTAGTLHSTSFRAVMAARPKGSPRIDMNTYKCDDILRRVTDEQFLHVDEYRTMKAPVLNMVSMLKARAAEYGAMNDPHDARELIDAIINHYGIDEWLPSYYDVTSEVYLRSYEQREILDFDDQLLFGLDAESKFQRYDNIFVDESQDLNAVQIDLIAKMARLDSTLPSRVVFVGDTRQSIYAFRGADPAAIATIADRFDTKSLQLSISWRCSKAVIAEAQKLVPWIEHAPQAVAGIVDDIRERDFFNKLQPGDYVLCRTTAPLVEACLRLLSQKKRAAVLGKDIGTNLCRILDRVDKYVDDREAERKTAKLLSKKRGGKAAPVPTEALDEDGNEIELDLMNSLTLYHQSELDKIHSDDPRSESKTAALSDKINAIRAIAIECETTNEVRAVIKDIFSDEVRGITLSTIHKAKGLEADRIFILRPDLLPFPYAKLPWEREQEQNLHYVAITRAKRHLTRVIPEPKEGSGDSERAEQECFDEDNSEERLTTQRGVML